MSSMAASCTMSCATWRRAEGRGHAATTTKAPDHGPVPFSLPRHRGPEPAFRRESRPCFLPQTATLRESRLMAPQVRQPSLRSKTACRPPETCLKVSNPVSSRNNHFQTGHVFTNLPYFCAPPVCAIVTSLKRKTFPRLRYERRTTEEGIDPEVAGNFQWAASCCQAACFETTRHFSSQD